MWTTTTSDRRRESGMTLIAVMAIMAIFAVALLAVAPMVATEVQRERELEAIARGEEVAEAIRQYVEFYRGAKLPQSMDDLLEGLPEGTKTRQILRPSAAIDPLSKDGKWRLIPADGKSLAPFAKSVQAYNGGLLPSSPSQVFDRWAVVIVNSLNTETEEDKTAPISEDIEIQTENTPFIGVASQDRGKSIVAYYGLENHSKWIFTPLFRGTGVSVQPGRQMGNAANSAWNAVK
ncbi:MAG: type II secretion system protein [Acidobacteria bacterium]|nr:type II secretion system protein [Acidobacteriota bacterium]